jgi:hypothetical protein
MDKLRLDGCAPVHALKGVWLHVREGLGGESGELVLTW